MLKLTISIFLSLSLLFLFSCKNFNRGYKYQDENDIKIEENKYEYSIEVSRSAHIPKDGSGPVAGFSEVQNPDKIITFSAVGERIYVENGTTVNFIYDGIDPDETYIMYESVDDGYNLMLVYLNDKIDINFKKMCQIYIIGNPFLTNIYIPDALKYEQIIWTPRKDRTWELRIGTTQRGCKSVSLNHLVKLRNKQYEKNIPK